MSGHGWNIPNPDGTKARCGGPSLCLTCALELAAINGNLAESRQRQREKLVNDLMDAEAALGRERLRAEAAERERDEARRLEQLATDAYREADVRANAMQHRAERAEGERDQYRQSNDLAVEEMERNRVNLGNVILECQVLLAWNGGNGGMDRDTAARLLGLTGGPREVHESLSRKRERHIRTALEVAEG